MNRRDFLKKAGTFTAGAATGAAISAAAWTRDVSADFYGDIEQRFQQVTNQMDDLSKTLSGKMDGMAIRMNFMSAETAMHRAMLNLLFVLMLVSYAVDGGTAFMLLTM